MKDLKTQFNQYKAVIVLLLGVVLAIVSYLYGYTAYNEKTSQIKEDTKVLQGQYDNLKKMYDNKASYEKKTEELNADYDKLIKKYDGGVNNESVIMDTVAIEEKSKALVTSLGLTPNQSVYTFGANTSSNPDNAVASGIHSDLTGVETTYTTIAQGEYKEIKTVLKELIENSKRKVITSASFTSDDSNGKMTLTMSINEFAITGGDRKQTAVVIPSMKHSVENIFNNGVLGTGDAQ